MRRAWSAIALLGALAFARPASAQSAVDQAKHLFEAGAQYYSNGQYAAAIQAFGAANKLLPKPAIEFSLAQAHRRQYFLDKNPEHLTAAIRLYQGYVAGGGSRVADASQALEELQTIANKLSAEERAQAARAPTKEPPRIMIMSQTPGAQVVLDKTPAKAVPFGPDVTAGKHHIHVFAPGFFDYDQDVQAFDGTVTPVNADLKEKTAQLLLSSPPNASVSIDGRFAGTTPLPAALSIPAGRHLVVVTKNGRQAFVRDIVLQRAERKTLTVEMSVTGQRVVAESLFVGAAVVVVAGGAFTGVALVQQGKAT
ncbi:MAG: PEGA domain-containing protein, partial [Polyangiaceae bacterium]